MRARTLTLALKIINPRQPRASYRVCYLEERDNIVSRVVVGDNTNDSEREPHKELTKDERIGLDLTGRQKPKKKRAKARRFGDFCSCGVAQK